ncbi:capsular polysaccharide export protein, LipB/KpsS family [Aliirhizobium smilacinae]|uniref:Capsular biosynthesis protein n=1 Tax=Aliirhizobium smilacinae TaxID=1395944 RepID=A0A5C4XU08_9HYPH|nr:hypothetical protein [Rhizobium smilacinae]TNM66164.1 hypothetical protein FHP24_08125 [Rhizobium smilacinae]
MFNVVSHIEKAISQGRYRLWVRLILKSGDFIGRLTGAQRLSRLSLRGMIFAAERDNDVPTLEELLVRYSRKHPVSWKILQEFSKTGKLTSDHEIMSGPYIDSEVRDLIKADSLRAEGFVDEAIAVLLKVKGSTLDLRQQVTNLLRSLYHQKQDHLGIAELLIRFIEAEESEILIKQSVAAAASSEAAQREDLFAKAVVRVRRDIERVLSDRSAFKRHWKDAVEGAVSLFEIDKAVNIAQQAKMLRLKTGRILEDLIELRVDVEPIRHVVDEARRDFLERSGVQKSFSHPSKAIVVMPAAAVRSNKIDYSGFRADIRCCIKEIVATLERDGIPFTIKGRIRTHGVLSFDKPYFSYHTVSDDAKGLHFKETDRPSLFSFDNHGYAGWSDFGSRPYSDLSVFDVDQLEADRFFKNDQQRIFSNRLSKYAQEDVAETLPSAFIFVALQVIGDAVQSLAYSTPFAMLDEVIKTAKREGLSVVVKRHPACRSSQISRYLSDHQEDLIVSNGNIHDIIPAAKAVCIVNSGVGAEALLYEKPVYIFGRSDYMGACFVCETAQKFAEIFLPDAVKLNSADLRKFWYIFRTRYACDLRDANAASFWIETRVRQHLKNLN